MSLKRKRRSESCVVCKKKKVKCDRTRPTCSSCEEKSLFCIYQELDTSNLESYQLAAVVPISIVKDPVVLFNDRLKLRDGYDPVYKRAGRLISQGPLSYQTMMLKDKYLKVLLIKKRKEQKSKISGSLFNNTSDKLSKDTILNQIILLTNSVNREKELFFRNILLENEGLIGSERSNILKTIMPKSSASPINYKFDILANSLNPSKSIIILKIEEVLPPFTICSILLNNFYTSLLYPFIPIIDEKIIRERLKKIIAVDSDDKISIRINHEFDWSFTAIFLTILRLSFLTLLRSKNNTVEQTLALAVTNIGLDYIKIAEACINQFSLLERGSLPLLRSILFMKFYHQYAPEKGDGIDSGYAEVTNGLTYRMATSIGLHYDLQDNPSYLNNHHYQQMWRRTWFTVLFNSQDISSRKGLDYLPFDNCYTTLLPGGNATPVEEQISITFQTSFEISKILEPLLKLIFDVTSQPLVQKELLPLIESVVAKSNEILGVSSFVDILLLPTETGPQSVIKVYKAIQYLKVDCLSFTLYYYIFLHYDGQLQKDHFIQSFIKLVNISNEVLPLFKIMSGLFSKEKEFENNDNFSKLFKGSGSRLLLIPHCQPFLDKITQFYNTVVSRLLHYNYNYDIEQDKTAILQKLLSLFWEKLEIVQNFNTSASETYYHSWRANKLQRYFISLLKDKDNVFDRKSAVNMDCIMNEKNMAYNHYKLLPFKNSLMLLSASELLSIFTASNLSRFDTFLEIVEMQKSDPTEQKDHNDLLDDDVWVDLLRIFDKSADNADTEFLDFDLYQSSFEDFGG